jgi:hypothetical protein
MSESAKESDVFFIISSELLNEDNEISLLMFSKRYSDGRIFLEFSNQKVAESWINSLARPHKERWTNILKNSTQLSTRYNLKKIYTSALIVKIAHDVPSSVWGEEKILTLDDAVALADQGIKIGLENSRNDLSFIKTLLPERSRQHIDHLISLGHLEIVGGGGIGELKKILELRGINESFRALSWIMFDSDATYPNEPVKSTQDIVDVCNKLGIFYHCLARRSIENYISKEIYELTHPGPINEKAKAVYSLSPEQLSHFNMKIGFKSSSEKKLDLYKDLKPELVRKLNDGFGSKFAANTFSESESHESIHNLHKKNSTLNEFGTKLHHLANLLGRPV